MLFGAKAVSWLLVVISLACGEGVGRAAPFSVEQDQLKAVYLYNFLHVVTWPVLGKGEAPTEKIIGILGDSPLNATLDDLAKSARKGQNGTLTIIHFGRYRQGMDLGRCHILFVSGSEKENFRNIAAGLKHLPVLTVADDEDFLDAGGMIALVEQQNRLRYRVNRLAANEAGLRLSSQLLQTAISVQEK